MLFGQRCVQWTEITYVFVCKVLVFIQEIRTMINMKLFLIVLIMGIIGLVIANILQYVQADYGVAVGKLAEKA